jgi:hypothetical protein
MTADPKRPKRFFNSNDPTKGGLILYTSAGILVPYWLDTNGNKAVDATENWANPDSYQLIAPGIDKKYGTTVNPNPMTDYGRLYPSGFNYDASSALADDDNATNFTSKAKIGDDKP